MTVSSSESYAKSFGSTESIDKYGGLLQPPFYKVLSRAIVSLYSYIDNVVPQMQALHYIVTFFRLVQILGISLFVPFTRLWGNGSVLQKTLSYFSVLFHILPFEYRSLYAEYIEWGYIVIGVLGLLFIVGCAWYYKQTAKLHIAFCYAVYIYTISLGFVLHPIAGFYVGGILTRVITGEYQATFKYIFLIVATLLLTFLYSWFIKQYYCLSLLFRACSLQTLDEYGQLVLIFTTIVNTFLIAATLRLNNTEIMILCIVAAIIHLSNIHLLYTHATFLHSLDAKLVLATSMTAAIFTIIGMACLVKGIVLGSISLFIMIAIYVVMFFVASFMVRMKDKKYLKILDEFDETHEILFKHWRFGPASITGLQYAHPCYIDLSIFKAATQEWPQSPLVWVTFAKVCAIYPEYQSQMMFIDQSIESNKIKGQAKQILSQIRSLSKTRETNLSPDLKSKLSHISKTINKAKQRMRNIWDLILQGNIGEMEHSIQSAYESVDRARQQLEHLKMQFPNNRFVARQYARFLLEVLADQDNAKTWKENVRLLQRGIPISPDIAHTLGTQALPNFPTKMELEQSQNFAATLEIGDTSEDILADEDTSDESASIISQLINSHKVAAVTCMQITSIILFLVCVALPVIVLMAMFSPYTSEIVDPLSQLYGVSYMRHLVGVVPSFTLRYMEENVPDPDEPSQKYASIPDVSDYTLDSLGNNYNAKDQLKFLLTEVVDSSALLGPIRSYATDSEIMDQVRDLLFTNSISYFTCTTAQINTTEQVSSETLLSRVANQASELLNLETVTAADMVSPTKLTATTNYFQATNSLATALDLMLQYLTNVVSDNKTLYTIIAIVLSVVICIIYIVAFIIQLYMFNSNKNKVFKSLTYLPKTVISSVSASFYQLKKDNNGTSASSIDTDAEMNKQEENAIKIFSSISDESSSSTSAVYYFFTNFLIMVCAVVAIVVICLSYVNISDSILTDAPQIDNILGTCSSLSRSFINLMKICEEADGFTGVTYAISVERQWLQDALNSMVSYFMSATFGSEGAEIPPFSDMESAVATADEEVSCPSETTAPESLVTNVNCFDVRMRTILLNSLIYKRISATKLDVYPRARGDQITSLWQIGPILMYDSFYYHVIRDIISTMTRQVDVEQTNCIIVGVIMLVIALLFTLILIFEANYMQTRLIFTLKQLLHCPPSAVIASTKIMSLLSGNYSNEVDDTTERTSSFFAEVVNKLTDLVVVVKKEDLSVVSSNATFNKMFKIEGNELIGKEINQFFKNGSFEGNVDDIFNQPTTLIYTGNGEKQYILFQTAVAHTNYIISGRDKSMQVAHQQLISDERKKSDALLSSILPPSMVSRVQAGETEISFAVQSVSVLFLDIVSFTPWCGSHDAAYIMKTLNHIFKELDALVATHKTLTKIKCIGDCYMAAAGIFDEVNNPTQHAREMVEFGCEAINTIRMVDDINNEQLQIRVGINTGGPIVAGVLGIDSKPTFEILGPTINIAQQMEHHGVPMMVHISRPVYELIYGGSFSIKERGEVEVKNGKMFTYLVTPPPYQKRQPE